MNSVTPSGIGRYFSVPERFTISVTLAWSMSGCQSHLVMRFSVTATRKT